MKSITAKGTVIKRYFIIYLFFKRLLNSCFYIMYYVEEEKQSEFMEGLVKTELCWSAYFTFPAFFQQY